MLEKSIKQLNRVSIWVSLGLWLWLVLGLGLVLGLVPFSNSKVPSSHLHVSPLLTEVE